ncbi:MAG: histidine kinase [Chitinophagaceae bacterium]|nr:histidine kinase [Chitinophagaceae bacterium]
MKRRIPDPILIIITLLALTGFQAYWLKENYDREKRAMQIKTGVAFQETIRQLQMKKLKLPGHFKNDTAKSKRRILINEDYADNKNSSSMPRSQIITMVNTLRNSVKRDSLPGSTVLITSGKRMPMDFKTTSIIKFRKDGDSNDHVFNLLYRVDSLQDSLKLPEIIKGYSEALKKDNLDIPFKIIKLDSAEIEEEEMDLSEVTVGFAHPVTYRLSLGNTTPYLMKKITLPILFSLFLAGVTIFSFVLLYRNLLRQQKLAEIKNEFISNITHELKTPIATVGVAIEALKSFNAMHDPQKTKEYLDISANELQRLNLLVDKVLKLSMFEKKEIELSKEHFNMKELTQEVLDTMKLQFEKNNTVMNFVTAGNDFSITADKLHITSVIYNLLDNALKYRKENAVINVHLSAQQNSMELKVNDNGIGIAHEYVGKIFDKFFRVPTGNKHVVKGYGLGLSYVSHIIAQHNGTIHVESEINHGSTFIIKIPKTNGEG